MEKDKPDGIILICPRTHRTETIPTDDFVAAVKQASFSDACALLKEPKCVLFLDYNGYVTRVTIEEGRTLVDALEAIVRYQNAWRRIGRKHGGRNDG